MRIPRDIDALSNMAATTIMPRRREGMWMGLESNGPDVAGEMQFSDKRNTAMPEGQPAPRAARRGSEQVYVDDLSYDPLPFTDTLWVSFADDE